LLSRAITALALAAAAFTGLELPESFVALADEVFE
jgi:hypothetical protein